MGFPRVPLRVLRMSMTCADAAALVMDSYRRRFEGEMTAEHVAKIRRSNEIEHALRLAGLAAEREALFASPAQKPSPGKLPQADTRRRPDGRTTAPRSVVALARIPPSCS